MSMDTMVNTKVMFPAEIYAQFRPLYPRELFDLLKDWTAACGVAVLARIADIGGCGPGPSTVSLADSGLARELCAIESNPRLVALLKTDPRLESMPLHPIERPVIARFRWLRALAGASWWA